MFDTATATATAKVALAIGDPDRIGTPSPSFPRFQLLTLNSQPLSLQHSKLQTFQPSNVFRPIPLSFQTLEHSFALFCTFLHSPKTQLFSFQSFPHSLQKTPGGGGTPTPSSRKK